MGFYVPWWDVCLLAWQKPQIERYEVSSPSPLVVCLFTSFIHLNRIINSRFVSFCCEFLMALKRHRHRHLIGLDILLKSGLMWSRSRSFKWSRCGGMVDVGRNIPTVSLNGRGKSRSIVEKNIFDFFRTAQKGVWLFSNFVDAESDKKDHEILIDMFLKTDFH